MIEAHAPGKLVICGEYAVLDGAPAIAVAVDLRAHAKLREAGSVCGLSVAGGGSWSFSWRDGRPQWRERPPDGQGRILEAVAATLAEDGREISAALTVDLDTRAFHAAGPDGRREKLGLGSSAALTVALTAALWAQVSGQSPQPQPLFDLCARAHRRFQAGAGSGIDVAAAVHGGVVALQGAGGALHRLAWPDGLAWLAVWSGESASTRQMVSRYQAYRRAEPARFARQTAILGEIAACALQAWERLQVAALLRSLADYDDALRSLDSGAGIGIYTPAHERLARLAAGEGAVYKVSGAGGGDFGIALADSQAVIDRLAAMFEREGLLTLPGTSGAGGVVVG